MNNLFFYALIFSLFSQVSFGQEIDYLSLAQKLLKDGNLSRANLSLKNAKKNWDDIEEQKYFLLKGLYYLRKNELQKAILLFKKVGDEEYLKKKQIYMAESYFKLENFKMSLEWVNKIKLTEEDSVSLRVLKSKILFHNRKYQEAFDTVKIKKLSKRKQRLLSRLKVKFLIDLKLYESAFLEIKQFFSSSRPLKDYLYFSHLFRSEKKFVKSIKILEMGNLKFPNNNKLTMALAKSYASVGKVNVASDLFLKFAYMNPKFNYQAVEFLKSIGKIERAKILNMAVKSPVKKLSQKLSLYILEEDYSLAKSLGVPLKQHGVLKKDEIKYAFAYGLIMEGDYTQSIDLLKTIKTPSLISKGLKLMKVANECKMKNWNCHGSL